MQSPVPSTDRLDFLAAVNRLLDAADQARVLRDKVLREVNAAPASQEGDQAERQRQGAAR